MSQLPAVVQRRIAERFAKQLHRLPPNYPPAVYLADITEIEVARFETEQQAHRDRARESAAIRQLFRFIDDAPANAEALYKGHRI